MLSMRTQIIENLMICVYDEMGERWFLSNAAAAQAASETAQRSERANAHSSNKALY